jgi:hypothetical protein
MVERTAHIALLLTGDTSPISGTVAVDTRRAALVLRLARADRNDRSSAQHGRFASGLPGRAAEPDQHHGG